MVSTYEKRLAKILAVTALAFGLSACGPSSEGATVGEEIDGAVEQTMHAAQSAQHEAQRALAATEHTMDAVLHSAKDAAQATLNAAGDAVLKAKVSAVLLADSELSALKIQVDAQDGVVSLHGDAVNQAAKDRAAVLVRTVEGVVAVRNELHVP